MTASDFTNAGVPIDDTPTAILDAECALYWIKHNTTLTIDKENLSELPAGAKMFILKFNEIMNTNTTVSSESLGGMSQSFRTTSKSELIDDLASHLLGDYYSGSSVSFIPAKRGWRSCHGH